MISVPSVDTARGPASWLRSKPYWTPFLPSQSPGDFTMPDLIRFTGYGLTEITGPGGGGPGG